MIKVLPKITICILIIASFLSIYFGSYLPVRKGSLYIEAVRSASSVRTVEQFKEHFGRVLNFYSPIGQEEVVKFLGGDIVNLLGKPGQPEEVSRQLTEFIEKHSFNNNVRHLLGMAQSYLFLWSYYGKEEDFLKSEDYYKKGLAIGPKIPPLLYGLLNLYLAKGEVEKAKGVGEMILEYWPNETRIIRNNS